METVKVVNKKTKIVKSIPKYLLSDYLGTTDWDLVKDSNSAKQTPKAISTIETEIDNG